MERDTPGNPGPDVPSCARTATCRTRARSRGRRPSIAVDFDDGFGKGPRGFLGQIVPDAAFDEPVRVLAREFLGVGCGVRMRGAICITFKGDCGHLDDRS